MIKYLATKLIQQRMVFLMKNSIKYFEENCITKFEKLEDEFMKNPETLAEYVMNMTEELHKFGLKMLRESLETMDELLCKSTLRKQKWLIEAHSNKQLITSLGTVYFSKTLFTNKETGKSEYLLDRLIGLGRNERMTEDAEAKMLEEAVQTSYRRGGEAASLTTDVSKQTVKNKIHQLEFPSDNSKIEQKKIVEYLYIDADEDHVSLQFRETKGDLIKTTSGKKNNSLITKLVYIYEGIENEAPKSKRHCLVNPYYFCDVNTGKDNEEFWNDIYRYINETYDLEKIKKIYINSDGGGWIKTGLKKIAETIHVLDGYHLEQSITRMTSHMKDSREDAKNEVREVIREHTRSAFESIVDRLIGCLEDESGIKRIEEEKRYILSNWRAAKLRLKHKAGVMGSSTEGHVSHILSSRMSSRPMGWSRTGAKNMARLRAYYLNDGDMLELVRYQKKKLPKVVGAEYDDVLSGHEILLSERNRHGELGKYVESITHSMSDHNRKVIYLSKHIWGL